VAVVTVLQQRAGDLGHRGRRIPWVLAALDAMNAVWMVTAGDWLDRHLPVVSLGGQHQLGFWLSVAGFALLAGLAAVTGGFTVVRRPQQVLLAVAGVVSTVALAGVLAGLAVLAVAVPVIAVAGRILR
jgi:hypothetical protein